MNRAAPLGAGVQLALLTAIVSGVSVYANSFGVREVPDPFVFTTAKNLVVALVLATLIVGPLHLRELRGLDRRQWGWLLLIGSVGGSVPFLLFFYGLQHASAPSAAFMHKTLFIWVALLAVPLLGERLGALQLGALAVLVLGHLALAGRPADWDVSGAEAATLAATLLWAVEAILARRLLARRALSAPVAALGRMGFGALIMLGYVSASGRGGELVSLEALQWWWVLLTAAFLVAYVLGYYAALQRAPATVVTSVLVLGSVITSLLHATFDDRVYSAEQFAGFALVALAVALWLLAERQGRRASRREAAYARG